MTTELRPTPLPRSHPEQDTPHGPAASSSRALILRLLGTIAIVGGGAAVALIFPLDGFARSTAFFTLASALLAIGLFASTASISRRHLTTDWRIVLTAVTVGVLVKAAIISAVMYGFFRDPAYIVLGAAMAQIDPLSVAALQRGSRLSARGKAILSAWSSFDDPVTTILVILLAGLAVQATGQPGTAVATGLMALPVASILGNVLLVAGAGLAWWLLRRVPGRPDGDRAPSTAWQALAVVALLGIVAVAVSEFLMLAVAVTGLFFRPHIDRLLGRASGVAFVVAAFLLGIVLAGSMDIEQSIVQGVALGVTTYLAQVVVGLVIARRLPGDRWRLALSQQSGITAILLAVLLESALPGTVAVVAPAILVVNVLHLVANTCFDRCAARTTKRRSASGEQSDERTTGSDSIDSQAERAALSRLRTAHGS